MHGDVDSLLSNVVMRAPASDGEMAQFFGEVGELPHKDYLYFMRRHNGCDGRVGKRSYVCIWPVHEVVSGTNDAGATEFAPGLLLFGGDGGDTAYAFDRSNAGWPIVAVSLSFLTREEMVPIAQTFSRFIERLAADDLCE